MDRRAFVQAGAVSGLALAVAPTAAPAQFKPTIPRPGPVDDMDAYLARVDEGMERIGRWSVTADHPGFSGDREATDTLARTAMQTMFLTGMLGDLPVEQQLHPGMQERLWAALPTMDEALDRSREFLTTRTDEEMARVQAALRGPHRAAERVADALDEQAELTGVSPWRREQLRGMVTLAGWRLANQPPDLMVSEYLEKIDRVDPSDIALEAKKRWLAAQVGERLFWARADAADGVVTPHTLGDQPSSPRERMIARGAKGMGIGILIFAAGAGLVALGGSGSSGGGNEIGSAPVVVGLITGTVGAVWFIIAFFTLLIGLMMRNEPDHVTQPEPRPGRP
jgi:hypothetical protein